MVSERECTRAWAAPFPIPFSRFNSLTKTNAKTRRDESNKTSKTKTKEERKKNRERKKERSLSLSLCVWVVLRRVHTWLGQFTTWKCIFLSFFLSHLRRINDEKFWREFFFLLLFFCCCEKRSLFLLCCFKTKVFCTRDFFFSLFLLPFWKNNTTLDSLLTVKKRVRERDSEREREDHRSLAALKDPSSATSREHHCCPRDFEINFCFLTAFPRSRCCCRVLS